MGFEDIAAYKFCKKNNMHIMAVFILISLLWCGTLLSKEQGLKREISENCGWGDDNYYCYCEKSDAMEIKNKMDGIDILDGIDLTNFSINAGSENVPLVG